ncbi:MAG: hypothetical protein AMXMBFR56_80010 [Polyangiaceae bacterium]
MGFAFVLGAIAVGAAGTVACGGEDFDSCEANATCPPGTGGTDGGTGGSGGSGGTGGTGGTSGTGGDGGTGGVSGGGGTGGDGGGCDTSKSPSEEACLVSDENAVFVSPTGASTGAGTKASPLKSFADAVAKAKTAGHGRVIACNGDYDEKLTLTNTADGIKVYGGFKCSDWSYDASAKANLKPTTRGIVLTVDTLAAGATFEDVAFIAMPGTDPGESSIAGFVKESGAISMKRVRLEAGKGVKGAAGTKTDVTYPTATDLKGNDATGDTGGGGKQCSCPASADKSVGGKGGDGGVSVTGGGPGQPALGGGLGGQAGAPCAGTGTGGDGAPAPAVNPSPGASKVGSLSTSGWTGTSGGDGAPGGPGQGGGGGTGIVTGGGGGGGGCGACGGAPGKGGGAGGSSIALLALNTVVSLDSSEVVSADAGEGGAGAAGQQGQQIGGGGGNKSGLACSGGNGGKGADGGAGGGGAGGVSAGVVWKGKAPTLNTTTPTLGNKGAKGAGGKAGTNDGIDGDAKATLEVQ